jgi:hypothetical protein
MRRTALILALALGWLAATSVRGADNDLSALQQRVNRLEALTERVEAISAIKRLQHAYGHYSELGLWHDFADLFADSGVGYYTQGALKRDGIRELFVKEVGQGQLGLADGRIYPHISMQPVVTIAPDGQSGKARWHIMAMLGGYKGNASWAGGVYENSYIRENGVWKMQEVRYHAQYGGRYDAPGWTPTNATTPFHFDPSRVGKPILDIPVRGPGSPDPGFSIASLGRRLADLSSRAQRLSDESEVTNLQHAYAYYVDRKMWDDVADLFAGGGTMEIGLQGVYVGPKSIRRGLGQAGLVEGELNDHVQLQTVVTVLPDGTARARGTDIGMLGPPSPGGSGAASPPRRARWTQSIYEYQFV